MSKQSTIQTKPLSSGYPSIVEPYHVQTEPCTHLPIPNRGCAERAGFRPTFGEKGIPELIFTMGMTHTNMAVNFNRGLIACEVVCGHESLPNFDVHQGVPLKVHAHIGIADFGRSTKQSDLTRPPVGCQRWPALPAGRGERAPAGEGDLASTACRNDCTGSHCRNRGSTTA